MTMSAAVHGYMKQLYDAIYAQYSSSCLRPYPNVSLPQHAGKVVTQYHFDTQSLPLFTALHSL